MKVKTPNTDKWNEIKKKLKDSYLKRKNMENKEAYKLNKERSSIPKKIKSIKGNQNKIKHHEFLKHDYWEKSLSEESNVTKHSKSSNKNDSHEFEENIDLAIRKDVVNKTVLRCLRRYFSNIYRSKSQDYFESKIHRSKWYFESIKRFVTLIFDSDSSIDKTHLLHVQFYIGSIIFPKFLASSHAEECKIDEDLKQVFYDWVYKYSHTKLLSMFKFQPISIIYKYFYENAIDQALMSEPAIMKNPSIYKAAFDNFMAAFDKRIDPLVLVKEN